MYVNLNPVYFLKSLYTNPTVVVKKLSTKCALKRPTTPTRVWAWRPSPPNALRTVAPLVKRVVGAVGAKFRANVAPTDRTCWVRAALNPSERR
uniref:Uncharacterized protein n=1 Tax=Romanomermis culicivorax TaxID=13658 RepID=A0A915J612_ROMCU